MLSSCLPATVGDFAILYEGSNVVLQRNTKRNNHQQQRHQRPIDLVQSRML